MNYLHAFAMVMGLSGVCGKGGGQVTGIGLLTGGDTRAANMCKVCFFRGSFVFVEGDLAVCLLNARDGMAIIGSNKKGTHRVPSIRHCCIGLSFLDTETFDIAPPPADGGAVDDCSINNVDADIVAARIHSCGVEFPRSSGNAIRVERARSIGH